MTQRDVVVSAIAPIPIEPGIVEFQCEYCAHGFECDTNMGDLWKHLKEAHQVEGETTYHFNNELAINCKQFERKIHKAILEHLREDIL